MASGHILSSVKKQGGLYVESQLFIYSVHDPNPRTVCSTFKVGVPSSVKPHRHTERYSFIVIVNPVKFKILINYQERPTKI